MISGIAVGQISLSYSDFQGFFSLGATYVTYATPLNGPDVSVFVGEASATAQYWDFTNFTYDYVGKSWAVEPSTAPMINSFPEANLVALEKTWMLGPDTLYSWNYKKLLTDRLLMLGASDDTSVIISYDPPAIQGMIPYTYGVSWISERDSSSIMPGFSIITESHWAVDGFGTMKLPSSEYPCLRVIQNTMTITYTPLTTDTTRSRGYAFLADGMMEVNILGVSEDQFNLSTVVVGAIKISMHQGQSGINENGTFTGLPVLKQNNPNPVNQYTVISWQLSTPGHVVMKICDLMGKEIRTVADAEMIPGENHIDIDATGLKAGIYFYQLQVNGNISTKKMVVY